MRCTRGLDCLRRKGSDDIRNAPHGRSRTRRVCVASNLFACSSSRRPSFRPAINPKQRTPSFCAAVTACLVSLCLCSSRPLIIPQRITCDYRLMPLLINYTTAGTIRDKIKTTVIIEVGHRSAVRKKWRPCTTRFADSAACKNSSILSASCPHLCSNAWDPVTSP